MERVRLLLSILLLDLLPLTFADDNEPLAPAMFIFGDSLIDNGNNNYMLTAARANYLPYGIDSGGPTGRFCNGLTVVDYGATTTSTTISNRTDTTAVVCTPEKPLQIISSVYYLGNY
ncbi:GDSL esterase/lipase 7 [Ancistrocladus abbreviatus]